MVRNTRSVCKTCKKCDQQAAVATKTCSNCGYDFFKAKRKVDEILHTNSSSFEAVKTKRSTPCPSTSSGIVSDQKIKSKKLITEETRRTTRIRREKPQFYDSRQYDKKPKRLERPKRSHKQLVDSKDGSDVGDVKEPKSKKKLKSKDELIDDDINMMDKLSTEKQQYATFLLAEINRKLVGVQWRPQF